MANDFRILPVRLNEFELQQKGEQIAATYADLTRTENEKKQVTAEYGARIKELNNRIGQLSREINTKQEDRSVEVYEEKNHRSGMVEIRRSDTGEVVESRLMKDSERQRGLFSIGNGHTKAISDASDDEDDIFTEA